MASFRFGLESRLVFSAYRLATFLSEPCHDARVVLSDLDAFGRLAGGQGLISVLAQFHFTDQFPMVFRHVLDDLTLLLRERTPHGLAFPGTPQPEAMTVCPNCGASVSADQLIPAGDVTVCPNCREEYL